MPLRPGPHDVRSDIRDYDGGYGYINHVALYVLGRVALPTGDPAGLAQGRRSAARLGQVQESPARASWPW